ncbi:hypothetical protein [Desulfuromonas acetoxidans]|uniref:hypothetical protein n=1 Tax=Desulfuromonas acetoxidans TaxID=891 RepID=UPI00293165B3|nr:hypothetical protein [Desulfuromonas acetoxidans]
MVPESVQRAWQALDEKKKLKISRGLAKRQPQIFAHWVEAAGLRSFRQESLLNRKAGTASRFDGALFKAAQGALAADVLVAYFTELDTEVNEEYLAMLKGAGNEEEATRIGIYVQLATEYKEWPLLDLYLATALWMGEIDESELDTIKNQATEA